MGRTKKHSRASIAKVEPSTSVATKPPPSTASLIEKAQHLITQCNYELAHKFLARVLDREPSHVSARELFGEVQLEIGELDAAKQVLSFLSVLVRNNPLNIPQTFESLIPPSPSAPIPPSSSAHLNLAQLSDNSREALHHYQAAVDILLPQLKGKVRASGNNIDVEDDVKAKAVSALVAMVEIWMSDLWSGLLYPRLQSSLTP